MRTRISVTVDGHDKEIFLIRNRPDNSVLIAVRKPAEVSLGKFHGSFAERHITLHPSPGKPFITINDHARDGNKNYQKTQTRILPREGLFCWATNIQVWPDLSEPHYNLRLRSNDRAVRLGEYNPKDFALVTTLIAASPGLSLDLAGFPMHVVVQRYAEFDVIIGISLMDLPSTALGFSGIMFNHSPRLNGVDQLILQNRPTISPSPEEFSAYLTWLIGYSMNQFVETIRSTALSEGSVPTEEEMQALHRRAMSWRPGPREQ